MTITQNTVSVTYTDSELRNLVEEYITQQKSEFTLKGVCSYVLYWAVEDGRIANNKPLVESDELQPNDKTKILRVLDAIVIDGRITVIPSEDTRFVKK